MSHSLVILSMLLVISASNQCVGFNETYLIETGTNIFRNGGGKLREHCYSLTIGYVVPSKGFQVAVSTELFQHSPSNSGGIDYSVKAGQNPDKINQLDLLLLISDEAKWTQITVSYFVSSRNDLWLGSFLVDTFDILNCKRNSVSGYLESKAYVEKWNQTSHVGKRIQALIFISGLRTEDSSFRTEIVQTSFERASGKILVSINSNAFPNIQLLNLDYIIYEIDANSKFSIELFSTIEIAPSSYDYHFIGLDRFQAGFGSTIKYLGLAIISDRFSCVGTSCNPNSCESKAECKRNSGNIWGRTCIYCGIHQYYENGKCWNRCKGSWIYSTTLGKCVCRNGYTLINKRCEEIPVCDLKTEILINNQCSCQFGHIKLNGVCQPIVCGDYEFISNNQCICISGYTKINRNCVKIPNCSPNQTLQNSQCICKNGFYRTPNKLCWIIPQCLDDSEWLINYNCECRTGYGRRYKKCEKIPVCDRKGYWILKDWKCVCQDGFVEKNGICARIPVCNYSSEILKGDQCVCRGGFWRNNAICQQIPVCKSNEVLINSICICNIGYKRQNGICQQILCGPNYQIIGNACVCPLGFIQLGIICVPSCGINEQFANNVCVCRKNHVGVKNVCRPCPKYSISNSERTSCSCEDGYEYKDQNGECQKIRCQKDAQWKDGRCVCDQFFYWKDQQCFRAPQCPNNSEWNQEKLECICLSKIHHIIDRICQECSQNEGWNGNRCICKTQFSRVDGKCITCPNHTFYNGRDCICNPGFFGNRYGCEKCHGTCSKCTGKQSNQCTACTDVSFTLNSNGYCIRNSPCPNGLFLDGKICKVCSAFCADCESASTCKSCIDGFKVSQLVISGQTVSFCEEICGDGKRFQDQCDDNNIRNGDGCSSLCKVQDGWICAGGSSVRTSFCSEIQARSIIQPKSAVLLFGRVVQGIRLSHIPSGLSDNNCPECSKLLWVKVIRSDIVPGVLVSYIPKSKYQFLVEFNFHGTYAVPVFTFTVQLNPRYKQHFSDEDMRQLEIVTVDPALLARFDEEQTLDFGAIDGEVQVSLPSQAQEAAFDN